MIEERPQSTTVRVYRLAFRAGAAYFAIVFGAGFALAPIRELWAVPRFGERLAELAEMPLMLVAMLLAAGWTVRRWVVPGAAPVRLAMGGFALVLLLLAELGVVLGFRGLSPGEYVAGRDPVSGAVYLLMLLLFAVIPALVARR